MFPKKFFKMGFKKWSFVQSSIFQKIQKKQMGHVKLDLKNLRNWLGTNQQLLKRHEKRKLSACLFFHKIHSFRRTEMTICFRKLSVSFHKQDWGKTKNFFKLCKLNEQQQKFLTLCSLQHNRHSGEHLFLEGFTNLLEASQRLSQKSQTNKFFSWSLFGFSKASKIHWKTIICFWSNYISQKRRRKFKNFWFCKTQKSF